MSTFEPVEVAPRTTLIAMVNAPGDVATQRACETILPQRQAMADGLREHLPQITVQLLERDAADVTAMR